MTLEDKARDLVEEYSSMDGNFNDYEHDKKCAVIAVKNEYKSNRELLFNLRSCGVIENEKVYLSRLENLINEEKKLVEEIEKRPNQGSF